MNSMFFQDYNTIENTLYDIFLNYRPILKIRLWMIIDDGKYTINNNKYFLSIAGNQFTNANKFLLPTEYWQYVFWACLTYVSHLSFLFIPFYVIFVIFIVTIKKNMQRPDMCLLLYLHYHNKKLIEVESGRYS